MGGVTPDTIDVVVRYTGPLRGLAGRETDTVILPAGSSLRDLLRALAPRLPAAFGSKVLAPLESGDPPLALLLLNREHLRSPAGLDRPLAAGDVVAFVPPMEGG